MPLLKIMKTLTSAFFIKKIKNMYMYIDKRSE